MAVQHNQQHPKNGGSKNRKQVNAGAKTMSFLAAASKTSKQSRNTTTFSAVAATSPSKVGSAHRPTTAKGSKACNYAAAVASSTPQSPSSLPPRSSPVCMAGDSKKRRRCPQPSTSSSSASSSDESCPVSAWFSHHVFSSDEETSSPRKDVAKVTNACSTVSASTSSEKENASTTRRRQRNSVANNGGIIKEAENKSGKIVSGAKATAGAGKRSKKKCKGKKQSKKSAAAQAKELSVEEQAMYVAMDCEMVGVGYDGFASSLARVTIVDWNGNALLDQYVRPDRPVTDYRTFVSGITPHDLDEANPSAIDIQACREKVSAVLENKVLIGHGLKNDMNALGMKHPWYMIRDTAKYEPFMKVRCEADGILWPRKLKDLCQQKLKREIQLPGVPHSPYEDAVAAMDLYKAVRNKWERVMEYKINRTKEIESKKRQEQEQERHDHEPHTSSCESGDYHADADSEYSHHHHHHHDDDDVSTAALTLNSDSSVDADHHHMMSAPTNSPLRNKVEVTFVA